MRKVAQVVLVMNFQCSTFVLRVSKIKARTKMVVLLRWNNLMKVHPHHHPPSKATYWMWLMTQLTKSDTKASSRWVVLSLVMRLIINCCMIREERACSVTFWLRSHPWSHLDHLFRKVLALVTKSTKEYVRNSGAQSVKIYLKIQYSFLVIMYSAKAV